MCIPASVNYTGSISVTGNNAIICNSGTLGDNYSGGIINVASGLTGVVVNNLGVINSQTLKFNSPVTLNNGSSDGGTTVVSSGSCVTYFYNTNSALAAGCVFNNYKTWGGQFQPLAGTTVNNKVGATWTAPTYDATGSVVINNAGTWTVDVQASSVNNLTINNVAAWTAYVSNTNTGSTTTVSNQGSGTWQASQPNQVNYGGALTVQQGGGLWNTTLNANSASSSRLVVNVTSNWNWGIDFPAGPNSFTVAAAATGTLPNSSGFKNLSIGGPTAFQNNGTLTIASAITLPNTSSITNNANAIINLSASLTNTGTITNAGKLNSSGAGNTLTNSGTFTNSGALVIGTATTPCNFTNSGNLNGSATSTRGTVLVYGVSNNSGVVGGSGLLNFCDKSTTPANMGGFDTNTGTVNTGNGNVVYCAAPLPVSLTSFSAQRYEGQVLVQWTTASELNNKEFVVERSADGYAFVALETVAGHGTLAYRSTYSVTDARPLPGLSYYRLRQVDYDGTRTYSPVASMSRPVTEVTVYPNPTADAFTLDLSGLAAGPCLVRLLSLPGQLVLSQTLAGGQAQPLSLASLPAGTYLLEVVSAMQGRQVQRVVKY